MSVPAWILKLGKWALPYAADFAKPIAKDAGREIGKRIRVSKRRKRLIREGKVKPQPHDREWMEAENLCPNCAEGLSRNYGAGRECDYCPECGWRKFDFVEGGE